MKLDNVLLKGKGWRRGKDGEEWGRCTCKGAAAHSLGVGGEGNREELAAQVRGTGGP